MSVISKVRRQKAVWWKRSTAFSRTGEPTFEAAVVIDCRWESKQEEVLLNNGQTVVAKHVVYVDRELSVGDLLHLGAVDPVGSGWVVSAGPGIYPVQQVAAIPNFKNTETLHMAYL